MRRNRDHGASSECASPFGASKGVAGTRVKVIQRASALIYFTLKSPRIGGRKSGPHTRNRKWHVRGGRQLGGVTLFRTPIARDTCVLATSGATPSVPSRMPILSLSPLLFVFLSLFLVPFYCMSSSPPSSLFILSTIYFKVALSRHAESPRFETISRRQPPWKPYFFVPTPVDLLAFPLSPVPGSSSVSLPSPATPLGNGTAAGHQYHARVYHR